MDPDIDRNVEVTSSWRVCIEEVDYVRDQLQAGHRFGFVGCSDSHRALPGLGGALTGLYVTELTPEALYEAYMQRRTIATQGIRLLIDFHADGDEGPVFIGGEGVTAAAPHLTAAVEALRPIESVAVVRDGEIVHSEPAGETSHRLEWTDPDAAPGVHSYYLRVQLVGDPSFNISPEENELHRAFTQEGRYPGNLARARGVFAWTSPIWLTCPDITS